MKLIKKLLGKMSHNLKIVVSGEINIKIMDSNYKNRVIFDRNIPLKADIKLK